METNTVHTVLKDVAGFKVGDYVEVVEIYSPTHVYVYGYGGTKGSGYIRNDLLGPVMVYEVDTKELTISKFGSNLYDPWKVGFKTFKEAKDFLLYCTEKDLKESKLELYQAIKNLKKVKDIKRAGGRWVEINDKVTKEWIDNASYETLFTKWRHAPVGDPMLQGEVGEYFAKVLSKKRREVGSEEHVRISKSIG